MLPWIVAALMQLESYIPFDEDSDNAKQELRSYLIISIFGDFMRGTGRDFETVGRRASHGVRQRPSLDGGGLCGHSIM